MPDLYTLQGLIAYLGLISVIGLALCLIVVREWWIKF